VNNMKQDYIFSIDVGGTAIKLAIMNAEGKLQKLWQIPTNRKEEGKYIIDEIYEEFKQAIHNLQINKDDFIGVGMGAPGPILQNGVMKRATNIGWKNYPLKAKLEKRFQLPAFVENDANCAALGEMWQGAGKGLKNLVCITLGTGVGGGVIVNGEIVSGTSGGGGEIGHITVQYQDGAPCNCGKKGCIETIASATGVVRLAMEKIKRSNEETALTRLYKKYGKITAKDVFDLAAGNDPVCVQIVEEVSFYLGHVLGTLSSTLNPDAFIIGGGVSDAGETLLMPLEKYYRQFAFPSTVDDTKIIRATLGNQAGVYGAAYLVKNKLSYH
jgi:glucokinase